MGVTRLRAGGNRNSEKNTQQTLPESPESHQPANTYILDIRSPDCEKLHFRCFFFF